MCGICGVVALSGPLSPALRAALPAMTRRISRRGPDEEGVLFQGPAGLGHRRLSIIDRGHGQQPMSIRGGALSIVFNGEIYNHRALRAELDALGYRSDTTSDTEVILRAYDAWGPACLDKLEGMFAFAIFERATESLFLARDRLGKKPLYYAVLEGHLHFASELKSLKASPAWVGALNEAELEGYLCLGYVVAPETIYRGVKKLEAGHWLRLKDGRLETGAYWDIRDFDSDRRSPAAIRAAVAARLSSAVAARLESEVPLGAFLSGGIDSGLVLSAMSRALGPGVLAVTGAWDDRAHDESTAAGITARHLGADHRVGRLELRFDEVFDTILPYFDEPFADSSAIPTYYVSGLARRHVTVALSGDGGDESFGGYDFRYVPHAVEDRARSLAMGWGPVRAATRWLAQRWPRDRRLPRPLRLGTILDNLLRDAASAYFADLCFVKPGIAARILGRSGEADPRGGRVYEAATAPYRRCPSKSPIQRAGYADLKVYLADDVLVKVDRMSMIHGLEVRCPFLDHKLVEQAFRIPAAVKMPRLRSKMILRGIAARALPPSLLNLPKRGFTAPIARWLKEEAGGRFEDEVIDNPRLSLPIDRAFVGELMADHRRGFADHSYALWAVWMLARWSEAEPATSSRRQAGEPA